MLNVLEQVLGKVKAYWEWVYLLTDREGYIRTRHAFESRSLMGESLDSFVVNVALIETQS